MKVFYTSLATERQKTMLYMLLMKCLKANFNLFERLKIRKQTDFYFTTKAEIGDNVSSTGNEYGMTFFNSRLGRYTVIVYLDDYIITIEAKGEGGEEEQGNEKRSALSIGYNYFTVSEICRRISHELTHLYVFMTRANRIVHSYIDTAVRLGSESKMIMWKSIIVEGLKSQEKVMIYDVKETVLHVVSQEQDRSDNK